MPPTTRQQTIPFLWVYVLVFLAWLILTAVVTAFAISSSIQEVKARFNQYADGLQGSLFDRMQANQAVLEGFAALFGAIGKTDEGAARRYAAEILRHYPYIFDLEIVEPIRQEDMSTFIARQRKRHPEFEVHTFSYDSDREWKTLPAKAVYYPIIFLEPMRPGSEKVLGLDIDSVGFLRDAMFRSIRDGATSATPPFRLVEGNLAYVAFRPVKVGKKGKQAQDMALNGQVVDLVVDADALVKVNDGRFKDGFGVCIHHADFPETDPKGQLAMRPASAAGLLAGWLLPKFDDIRPIGVAGQPFVLAVHKQVDWSDLNRPLLGAIFAASAVCLVVLGAFVRTHYIGGKRQRNTEQQLRYLATYDSLTGIPNRNLLMDRLRQAVARAQRQNGTFALLFLDLNGFKTVNDTFGHEAGDQLLRAVADRISLCIRADDTVARWSGDEFVVVMENMEGADDAAQVVRKIKDTIAHPVHLGETQIKISASVGVAHFPLDAKDMDQLIRIADSRMYADKREATAAIMQGEDDLGG
jgi:diguanylate cyclase (GGDEF)-like protein